MKANSTIIKQEEGRVLRAFGEEFTIKLDARQTAGTFTLWHNTTPPGGGPPPHYHTEEDEVFMVQEGRMSFYLNGEWREVSAGTVVFAPRGSVHTFRNVGDQPGRMLIMTHPSGFEKFFARCAEEFNRPEGPDMDRITAISADHGIHFVNPIVNVETVNE